MIQRSRKSWAIFKWIRSAEPRESIPNEPNNSDVLGRENCTNTARSGHDFWIWSFCFCRRNTTRIGLTLLVMIFGIYRYKQLKNAKCDSLMLNMISLPVTLWSPWNKKSSWTISSIPIPLRRSPPEAARGHYKELYESIISKRLTKKVCIKAEESTRRKNERKYHKSRFNQLNLTLLHRKNANRNVQGRMSIFCLYSQSS